MVYCHMQTRPVFVCVGGGGGKTKGTCLPILIRVKVLRHALQHAAEENLSGRHSHAIHVTHTKAWSPKTRVFGGLRSQQSQVTHVEYTSPIKWVSSEATLLQEPI